MTDYGVAYLSCVGESFFQRDARNPLFRMNINVLCRYIKSVQTAMT